MKVKIASDLHLEWEDSAASRNLIIDAIFSGDIDVVILAGDITDRDDDIDMINDAAVRKGVKCLYVLGNHEYYGGNINYLPLKFNHSNVVLMTPDQIVKIDGVSFWGSTMWTELPDGYDPSKYVNDIKKICGLNAKVWNNLHRQHKQSLLDNIANIDVVITHHSPSNKSISSRFAHDLGNYCFSNDLDEIIAGSNVKLWVHGHVHSSFDYEIGRTRITCNPRGTFNSNDRFDWHKVVEL